MHQRVGADVVTMYYDGPITTLRMVDLYGENQERQESLIEIESSGWVTRTYPYTKVHVRLSREDLETALKMFDGEKVVDFHDEYVDPKPPVPKS